MAYPDPVDVLNLNKDIEFLANKFGLMSFAWKAMFLEAAAKYPRNLKAAGRYVTVFARPHIWTKWAPLTGAGQREKVFDQLKKRKYYSAPSKVRSTTPVESGTIDILQGLGPYPDNPIIKFVDDRELIIWNVTLPSHIFFPGWVEVQVEERSGETGLHFHGEGHGGFALVNEVGSQYVFNSGIAALKQDLINGTR